MPSNYEKIREDNIKEYGQGTRHLAFLGRLYTDRTHFIFELLQNAEDAGASKILFELFDDKLEVSHNGRLFNEPDVRGICGVDEGTKAEDLTQIGKFGIGFKSVYAYTSTPEIHSGDENFGIKDYVRPYSVERRNIKDSWTTLFVFRFDAEGTDPKIACQEIGKRLRNLSARTLLFLRKIGEIEYNLKDGEGVYLREEISRSYARKVTVIGQNNGQDEDENWLIFEQLVTVPDESVDVPVEIAFRLEDTTEDTAERIAKINDSPLVVYFPTEKPTRLGFLIQGPYRTTPARDNIPENDDWNKRLIKETAELLVKSLLHLKEIDLLSLSLLEALPIRAEDFPESNMFYPLFSRMREAFLSEELLPTDDGTFVAAPNAKLARGAELMRLLNQDQLRALLQSGDAVRWLTGRITQDQTHDLYLYLRHELEIDEIYPEEFARKLSRKFLVEQTDKWFIRFYNFLSKQEALWRRPGGVLRNKSILRLEGGSHVVPFKADNSPNAYLAVNTETVLPIVKVTLSSDEEAQKFLQKLGVPELDIVEEVIKKILPKYTNKSATVDSEENEHDLKKIEQAYKTDSMEKKKRLRDALRRTPFVFSEYPNEGKRAYCKPGQVYFSSDELRMYFANNNSFACVSRDHLYTNMLKELGVQESIRIQKTSSDWRGRVTLRDCHGSHKRGLNGFDLDICVDGLECVLSTLTQEKSAFVWNKIACPNTDCIRGVVESSTRQTYENSTKSEKVSEKFGKLLINTAWLPNSNGDMCRPNELTLDDLPESFVRDEKLANQLGMKKNIIAQLANELGIDQETIQFAKQIKDRKPVFPVRIINNSERRRKKLSDKIDAATPKKYIKQERSERITRNEIDPSTWLKNQYTNDHDQMVCQICKQEMPFRKHDGEYYFEAVEVLSNDYLTKENEAQFLALCPLCAARYKEFVKREENAMQELYQTLKNSDRLEVFFELGGWKTSLRFVETHSQDLRTILNR